jgi:hypothetical protein
VSENKALAVGGETAPVDTPGTLVHVEFDDGFPAIDIDVDALTWGDMELLEGGATAQLPYAALGDLLKRLAPSHYKKLSVRRDSARFFTALGKALQEAASPN